MVAGDNTWFQWMPEVLMANGLCNNCAESFFVDEKKIHERI